MCVEDANVDGTPTGELKPHCGQYLCRPSSDTGFQSLNACSDFNLAAKFSILHSQRGSGGPDATSISSLYSDDAQRFACWRRVHVFGDSSRPSSIDYFGSEPGKTLQSSYEQRARWWEGHMWHDIFLVFWTTFQVAMWMGLLAFFFWVHFRHEENEESMKKKKARKLAAKKQRAQEDGVQEEASPSLAKGDAASDDEDDDDFESVLMRAKIKGKNRPGFNVNLPLLEAMVDREDLNLRKAHRTAPASPKSTDFLRTFRILQLIRCYVTV